MNKNYQRVNTMAVKDSSKLPRSQELFIGFQHTLAMFGATILVPILTGLHVSVALFTSGLGTLVFHYLTGKKVPAYLGSSFAFIAPISIVISNGGGIPAAQGGIMVTGLLYALVAWLIYYLGPEKIKRIFPPIVTGPVIMIIGLYLADVAINQASEHVWVAMIALIGATISAVFGKGFFRLIPVITGLVVGYIAALFVGLVDFSPVMEAGWLGLPEFTRPAFELNAITIIAPVAVVSIIEHVGDVLAISETVGKGRELVTDPGLNKTMVGDGIATFLAGIFGGPPNTTYGENIGVLALTKVFDSKVMRIGAVFAIILSLVPKFGQLIQTIPNAVIGGISILLFGMIAAVGIRTLVESETDLKRSRNLVIASVILVLGLGGAVLEIGEMEFSGMALAAVVGIILNLILPDPGSKMTDDVRGEKSNF